MISCMGLVLVDPYHREQKMLLKLCETCSNCHGLKLFQMYAHITWVLHS